RRLRAAEVQRATEPQHVDTAQDRRVRRDRRGRQDLDVVEAELRQRQEVVLVAGVADRQVLQTPGRLVRQLGDLRRRRLRDVHVELLRRVLQRLLGVRGRDDRRAVRQDGHGDLVLQQRVEGAEVVDTRELE